MQRWTDYISSTDLHALRFFPLWERYTPKTPMGRKRKEASRPYRSDEKEEWQKEVTDVSKFLPLVKDQDRFELYVKGIEDIETFLVAWQMGREPLRIDWFHLQQFLQKGLRVLSLPDWEFAWSFFTPNAEKKWKEVLEILSPSNSRKNEISFHFEEIFPEIFHPLQEEAKQIEQEWAKIESDRKNRVEQELGFEIGRGSPFYISRKEGQKITQLKSHVHFVCVKETPFDVAFAWANSEEEIHLTKRKETLEHAWQLAEKKANAILAERISPYRIELISWVKAFGRLDDLYAKACLADTYQGTLPLWDDRSNEIEIRGGVHPWLAEQWSIKGESFTPVDLHIISGQVAVIVGPNMGGKSVAMKTLGLCTLMAQLGLLVPAEYFRFTPMNGIALIGGEQENMETGLSSFGGEVKQLVDLWQRESKEPYLVLCDEIGRGTNPEEGEALALAIVEALGEKNWYTCFISHYSAVVHVPEVRIYQIKGLPDEIGLENNGDQWFQYIDRRLHLVEKGNVPQTALTIAGWIGLSPKIIQRAKRILLDKENRK